MEYSIGFIGTGNMAEAMIGGIIQCDRLNREKVFASGRNKDRNRNIEEKFGIEILEGNKELANKCDVIILAVKPNVYREVIEEIREEVHQGKLVVAIAAGVELSDIKNMFNKDIRLIRTMPNTPAMIGEGMSAICREKESREEDVNTVIEIFKCFGEVEVIEESMMHAFIGLSGSSPAYVYMFIEAMADAGVQQGLKRDAAYRMAAQAVAGAGKMVIKTGEHPGVLKDKVCSPGGTTIEAVTELQIKGFKGTVISAVNKCVKKSKNMLDKMVTKQ